jgi:fructokinase
MLAIGFDIGGTKIEAALLRFVDAPGSTAPSGAGGEPLKKGLFPYETRGGRSLCGEVLARERVATQRQNGYDPIIAKMAELVRGVCTKAGVTLRMLNGNTLVLKDRDLTGDLLKSLGVQVAVRAENDANCFALGEALCGAGVSHARSSGKSIRQLTSVGIILGTGCGGGVVVNGDTLRGRRGGAAEIGHTVLREGGLPCYCGQRGCAEQTLSGSGLEQAFNARRYSQVREFQDAKAIFELATAQDPIAVATVKAFRQDLAVFLSNLTALFDPDFFVLGGGVSLQTAIYEGLSEAIAARAFLPESFVPVYRNELGDSAGVVGASLLIVKDL